MTKEEVQQRIQSTGIVPSIRIATEKEAIFAAESVCDSGIPIVEITMTVDNAVQVIAELSCRRPGMVIGAGTLLNTEMAQRCIDAGAKFLTSTGLDLEIIELAKNTGTLVFPGALTPTEVITAWKAGSDFVKVFPCAQAGGPDYIRALKRPLPQVPLIAAGGVNQQSAGNFILAGATAIGIGSQLIPGDAMRHRQKDWIGELTRRFLHIVKHARDQNEGYQPGVG